MKKVLLFCLLFFVFSGVFVFAWGPEDLTKFPPGMKDGDFIANLGIGLTPGYGTAPAVRFSLDYNLGIGDLSLPFFVGGIVSYWGFNSYFSLLSLGGRFGYHFNWGVKNLDTYAVTTTGWIMGFDYGGWFLFGVDIGARYFLNNWFGFWVEVGYTSLSVFDLGVAFKF